MKVYHGSNQIVDQPDIFHAVRNLDFGRGFYVTSFQYQAQLWARRRGFDGEPAVINQYELQENWQGWRVKTFDDDEQWLDFVCGCRRDNAGYQEFDLIQGKVADDKVFAVLNMYLRGEWDKRRALEEIKAYDTYDQIAFISQPALEALVRFEKAWEV